MPQIILAKKAKSNYFKDYLNLLGSFDQTAFARMEYADGFYPYPSVHSAAEINELEQLQSVLQKALKQVVTHYFDDLDLQKIVPLSKVVFSQLKRIKDVPYELGLIRPDYIYTTKNEVKICEINARFGFNAAYMSSFAHNAIIKKYSNSKPLNGTLLLQEDLLELKNKKLLVMKGREEGYDIQFLLLSAPKSQLVGPDYLDKPQTTKPDLLVLELHQDELEQSLTKACDYILTGGFVLNDPRTIFIVHDKRLLAALYDENIMKKYLSPSEVKQLRNYLIPSFTANRRSIQYKQASKAKASWMLKRAISGKGDGLIFGYDTPQKRWQRLLTSKNYVLQPFIAQKTFEFYDPHFQTTQNHCIAGTLPMWNDRVYGPGLSRIYSQKPHKFFRFIQPIGSK